MGQIDEFELRLTVREALENIYAEASDSEPKHKGKSTASEKSTAQKTLKTLGKKRKTFKGKAKAAFGWADDPEAALGAVYAKAGKNPKKESAEHADEVVIEVVEQS